MAKTIQQIQTLITEKYDAREIINEIADFLQANPSGGGGAASYLVYTALLTQSGTSAPTADVLENTLGDIVWTRQSAGNYIGTLEGAFTAGKTVTMITNNWDNNVIYICGENSFPDSIYIETKSIPTVDVDDKLVKTPVEIRVYQ